MEIIPGVGLPVAQVGQTLEEIEQFVGPATWADGHRASWGQHSPPFEVFFDDRGTSQLIEVHLAADGSARVTLDGVQLLSRPMDDVEADLAQRGIVGRRCGLVVDFDKGFTLWSLDEISASEDGEGPHGAPDRPLVVEGVALGAPQSSNVGVCGAA